MPQTATPSWGTEPPSKFSRAQWVNFVKSLTIALGGSIARSDIGAGIVYSGHIEPGAIAFAAGTKSGAAGSELYTVDLSPAPAALINGLWVLFKADAATTGATAQLKLAASGGGYLATKYLKLQNGADIPVGTISAGSMCMACYDLANGWFVLMTPELQTPVVVSGASRNLLIRTPNALSNTFAITADELVLKTTAGTPYLASAVNTSVQLGTSGLGLLDTGAVANSTWYAIVVGYKPTTGAVGAWLTLATNNTLALIAVSAPALYTYYAIVGYLRSDGSSQPVHFVQRDNWVWQTPQAAYSGNAPTSLTVLDLSAYVPPAAKEVGGSVGMNGTANALAMLIEGDSGSLGTSETFGGQQLGAATPGVATPSLAGVTPGASMNFLTVIGSTAQSIYWRAQAANACTLTVNRYRI